MFVDDESAIEKVQSNLSRARSYIDAIVARSGRHEAKEPELV